MKTVTDISSSAIRAATPADREAIAELLAKVELPANELDAHLAHFVVAYSENRLAGCAGMELYGDVVVLRSLAVHPDFRRYGLGKRLSIEILSKARCAGASQAVLLTHTATKLAESLGFVETDRELLPKAVLESWEFRSDCCRKAKCMRLRPIPN